MCRFFLFAFGSFSWLGIKVATWKVTFGEQKIDLETYYKFLHYSTLIG